MSLDMGQHFSALKKTRAAGQDVQSPNAVNGSLEQNMSREDEYAASSLDERDRVRSILNKTSLEVSHTNRDLKANNTPMTILKLSTELILDIAEYLPPSGYMSLSYSCRTVHNKMSASIAHVLGDKFPMGLSSDSAPCVVLRNIRFLERLELRSLLDRDGKIRSSKTFCSGCQCTHDSSLFSIASLAQPSIERQCLGRAGRVWICPHRTLDYHQVTSYGETRDVHKCGSSFISVRSGYRCPYSDSGCITGWPIMRVPRNGTPSNEQVKEALGPLNAAVCPHLHLNDARVASVYLQDCQKMRWQWLERERGPASDCRCFLCSPKGRVSVVCNFCCTEIL